VVVVVAAPGVVTFGHRLVLENLWGQGRRIGEIARLTGLSVSMVSREFLESFVVAHKKYPDELRPYASELTTHMREPTVGGCCPRSGRRR